MLLRCMSSRVASDAKPFKAALSGAPSVGALVLAGFAAASSAVTFSLTDPAAARPRREASESAAERSADRAERAAAKAAEKAAAEKAAQSMHPLTIVVSTRHQHLKVYDASGHVISEAPVSTGQSGHETPHGVFSIIAKEQMHHSNLYNDAPMPWMERITWSGVALHAGNLPGYPASHGCIRLPHAFSRSLYGLTRLGTRVIVASDDPHPQTFAHEDLFQPLPTEAEVAAAANMIASEPAQAAALSTVAAPGAGLSLLGITPASAGGNERGAPRTREQAAAERATRMASAKAIVADAEARRATAEAEARAAATAAGEAQNALRLARIDTGRLQQDIDKAERQTQATHKELGALARMAQRIDADKDDELTKAGETEQQLEDRLAALDKTIETARTALAAQGERIGAAERAAESAQAARVASANGLRQAGETLTAARDALAAQERAEANRDRPIAVLVSRKTGKLYVRQGFEPLFETPVEIEAAELPIGTHVFTAVGASDGGALRWSATTVQSGTAASDGLARRGKSRRGKDGKDAAVEPPDGETIAHASSAMSALDRVAVPRDARERIAEFIRTGASLIISDHGPGHETGRGTEFVVLTR